MAPRALPPNVDGVIDARAYLRLAVATLGTVDVDALDAAGRVAYAQALALVAIGARVRHLEYVPDATHAAQVIAGLAAS